MEVPIKIIYPEETDKKSLLKEKIVKAHFEMITEKMADLTVEERQTLLDMMIRNLHNIANSEENN